MASTTLPTDFRRALPTLVEAAKLIEIDPTGIGRAVKRLGVEPENWGGREKRLQIVDVLRIAAAARRASVDEVSAGLLDLVDEKAPELRPDVEREIDRYFDTKHPAAKAQATDAFLAEIAAALPPEHAAVVERIYQRYTNSR